MSSTKMIREISINLPSQQVWNTLADFGNICHGHPAVSKSFITSDQKTGVGATRHCDFTMTYTMKNILFDIMNALMMKRMNSQLLDGIMAGHKKYMETGEIVNEKTPLDLKQVLHVA
jgi:hypothetical protein